MKYHTDWIPILGTLTGTTVRIEDAFRPTLARVKSAVVLDLGQGKVVEVVLAPADKLVRSDLFRGGESTLTFENFSVPFSVVRTGLRRHELRVGAMVFSLTGRIPRAYSQSLAACLRSRLAALLSSLVRLRPASG